MPAVDLAYQADLVLRLVGSAVLGGLIGFEREIHQHPAGMRTHLLVSLGAASFTVLSIVAFTLPPAPNGSIPVDPSRVAAQIVSGIGFLGAGAILKFGTTVKGLTTAASLWATAAIGMASGAGAWVVAVAGTAIIVISLWPLHAIGDWVHRRSGRLLRVRMRMAGLETLASITHEVAARGIEIAGIHTELTGDRYELSLDLRLPPGTMAAEVIERVGGIAGAEVFEAQRVEHEE